jgi:hypothetical protein
MNPAQKPAQVERASIRVSSYDALHRTFILTSLPHLIHWIWWSFPQGNPQDRILGR